MNCSTRSTTEEQGIPGLRNPEGSTWACIDDDGQIVFRSDDFGQAWAYQRGRQDLDPVTLVEQRTLIDRDGRKIADPNEPDPSDG